MENPGIQTICPEDKKCINKEERVRHLPGYCPQTSQETEDAEER